MSEWKHQLLTDLFNVEIGGTPSRGVMRYWANDYDSQAYSWVSIADLGNSNVIKKTKERITTDGLNSSNAKLLPIDTLIFSFKLTIGKIAFTGVELTTNEAIAALIPKGNKVETKLIYYLLPDTLDRLVYDTAVKGKTLNKSKIAKITFFIPLDIGEQRKIATILCTLDNVIERTEAAIEKYNAIKAGIMRDLFTKGIDTQTGKLRPAFEEVPEFYKESKLGWIPKDWEVTEFKSACVEFINGGTPSTKNASNWVGTIPWITGADFLESFEVGFIRRHVNEEALRYSSSHLIREGNILLVTRTGVGKLAIAPFDVAISQDITGIILDPVKYSVEFFYYYLQELVENFKKMNQGTSINGIIRSDLEATLILKPSLDEQKQIAAVLNALDENLKNEQSNLSKYHDLKIGLMADLLTGKVRIK